VERIIQSVKRYQ